MKTKVIFLTNGAPYGYGYIAEDLAEIEQGKADLLISKRICAKVIEPYTKLPNKINFRDELIRAGFYSMEILEKVKPDETLDLGGIRVEIRDKILEKFKIRKLYNSL